MGFQLESFHQSSNGVGGRGRLFINSDESGMDMDERNDKNQNKNVLDELTTQRAEKLREDLIEQWSLPQRALPKDPREFLATKTLKAVFKDSKRLTIPDNLDLLTEIENLHVEGAEGVSSTLVSELLSKFEKITSLTLRDVGFLYCPPNIFTLGETLEHLDLSKNQIRHLPPEISNLKKLKTLNLSDNNLDLLGKEFFELEALESLDISDNSPSGKNAIKLAKSFDSLPKLKVKSNNVEVRVMPEPPAQKAEGQEAENKPVKEDETKDSKEPTSKGEEKAEAAKSSKTKPKIQGRNDELGFEEVPEPTKADDGNQPADHSPVKSQNDGEAKDKADTKEEAKAETAAEAKSEAKSDTKVEDKPEAKQEDKTESKPEAKAEDKPEAKQEAKTESKPEARPEAKSATVAEAKTSDKAEEKPAAKKDEPKAKEDAKANKDESPADNVERFRAANGGLTFTMGFTFAGATPLRGDDSSDVSPQPVMDVFKTMGRVKGHELGASDKDLALAREKLAKTIKEAEAGINLSPTLVYVPGDKKEGVTETILAEGSGTSIVRTNSESDENVLDFERIVVTDKNVDTIGGQLHLATKCKELEITTSKIPFLISKMKWLEKLVINVPLLAMLPNFISELSGLKELVIRQHYLGAIPLDFKKLENLEFLDIRSDFGSSYDEIPRPIFELPRLKKLKMGGLLMNTTHSIDFPAFDVKNLSIEELEISLCTASKIPYSICKLRGLKSLRIINCETLSAMDEVDFSAFPRLEEIRIKGAAIRDLPRSLYENESIRILHLEDLGQIMSISDNIENMVGLESFTIKDLPELTFISEMVGYLPRLKKLAISGAPNLNILPGTIGELQTLEELKLEKTKVEELPVKLRDLTSLKVLHLVDNRLTDLPEEVSKLSTLRDVVVSGNNFRDGVACLALFRNMREAEVSFDALRINHQSQVCQHVLNKMAGSNALNLKDDDIRAFAELEKCPWSDPSLFDDVHVVKISSRFSDKEIAMVARNVRNVTDITVVNEPEGGFQDARLLDLSAFRNLARLNVLSRIAPFSGFHPDMAKLPHFTGLKMVTPGQGVDDLDKIFPHLEILDLADMEIAAFPHGLENLRNLKSVVLNFKPDVKVAIPETFWSMDSLEEVGINAPGLEEIGASARSLRNVRDLVVVSSKLKDFPRDMKEMRSLRRLHMTVPASTLNMIPRDLMKLPSLEELQLEMPALTLIDKDIGNLSNLRRLLVKAGKIDRIDNEILNLDKLEDVEINAGKIVILPKALGSYLEERKKRPELKFNKYLSGKA